MGHRVRGMLDARQLEQPLAADQQLLRDYFVAEYLKDFNAYKAALRMGFQPVFAVEHSTLLFNDGYVQRKIQHMTRTQKIGDDEARLVVEHRLLEIAQRGSDNASVSAIREFNSMRGWSKPDGIAEGAEVLVEALKEFAQKAPA